MKGPQVSSNSKWGNLCLSSDVLSASNFVGVLLRPQRRAVSKAKFFWWVVLLDMKAKAAIHYTGSAAPGCQGFKKGTTQLRRHFLRRHPDTCGTEQPSPAVTNDTNWPHMLQLWKQAEVTRAKQSTPTNSSLSNTHRRHHYTLRPTEKVWELFCSSISHLPVPVFCIWGFAAFLCFVSV